MLRSVCGLRRAHMPKQKLKQRLRRRFGGIVGGLFVRIALLQLSCFVLSYFVRGMIWMPYSPVWPPNFIINFQAFSASGMPASTAMDKPVMACR